MIPGKRIDVLVLLAVLIGVIMVAGFACQCCNPVAVLRGR